MVIEIGDKMPKQEADMKLGGAIALLKAQCSVTYELCAREASQIMGGIAYTRGGQGMRNMYKSDCFGN